MNRPSRPADRRLEMALVVALLACLCPTAAAQEQEPETSAAPQPPDRLDLPYFELISRTIEEMRDDLKAVEPDISADALRGRLLIEALQLVNNVTGAGLGPDQLLTLPDSLREDASRIVSSVLGDRPTAPEPVPGPESPPPEEEAADVPVRVRPYAKLVGPYLASRFEDLVASGAADPSAELETIALEAVAGAVCPSNDPRDLAAEERSYAVALARRLARGEPEEADPPIEDDPALLDDLDAIAELLRRKNAELKLAEGIEGIDDRARRLEQFGLERLVEAVRRRNPQGTAPEPAALRVRMLAELIARGVPFTPQSEEPEGPVTTRLEEPETPDEGGEAIDPAILPAIEGLARAVDLGLIAAGVDLSTRRETLRRFSREQFARKAGEEPSTLPVDVVAGLDDLVERILAENPGTTVPVPPTVVVPQPPVVTVPPVAPVTYILVPNARPRWCPPWR